MIVNGNKIRSMINVVKMKIKINNIALKKSLRYFEGDIVPNPSEDEDKLSQSEMDLVILQTAQKEYNLAVNVNLFDTTMTLESAIKRKGTYDRLKNIYESALVGDNDRFSLSSQHIRKGDEEVALHTLTNADISEKLIKIETWREELKNSISDGNSKLIEIKSLSKLSD